MSWRKEIKAITDKSDVYKYDADANQFDSSWMPWLPLSAYKIAHPMRGKLHVQPGVSNFVILQPTIYRWLGIKRLKVVLGNPHRGLLHGDLAGTRRVVAAGQYKTEAFTPKRFWRRYNSIIIALTDRSGHYSPEFKSLNVAETVMRTYKIPMAKELQKINSYLGK